MSWPHILHEEVFTINNGETFVDLYIKGDHKDYIVQLTLEEWEKYKNIRGAYDDPNEALEAVVSAVNVPEFELECLVINELTQDTTSAVDVQPEQDNYKEEKE